MDSLNRYHPSTISPTKGAPCPCRTPSPVAPSSKPPSSPPPSPPHSPVMLHQPAHLAVDIPGKNVLVANYGGGSVEVIPVDEDGTLKTPSDFVQHTGRGAGRGQNVPRAHGAYPEPTGKYILCPDLALDKIFIY